MEQPLAFAENLRRYRRERRITQRELAEQLGYSEKTVSKWEIGAALPDVPTLARLADLWGMRMEELLYHAGQDVCYLGIDGGGNQTTFLLCDRHFLPLNRVEAGPCNPNEVGTEAMLRTLTDGIRQCCKDYRYDGIRAYAGISGAKTAGAVGRIERLLADFHFAAYGVGSDLDNLVQLGRQKDACMVLSLGTGIMGIAFNGQTGRRIAGWGSRFDEGGSGYHYGRDALAAVLRAYDGSGPSTVLTDLCAARLGAPVVESVAELLHMNNKQIAAFCVDVFQADALGDKAAQAIVRRNVQALIGVLDAGYDFVGAPVLDVAVSGGLVHQLTRITRELERLPHKPVRLSAIKEEAVMGAVYRAAKEKEKS